MLDSSPTSNLCWLCFPWNIKACWYIIFSNFCSYLFSQIFFLDYLHDGFFFGWSDVICMSWHLIYIHKLLVIFLNLWKEYYFVLYIILVTFDVSKLSLSHWLYIYRRGLIIISRCQYFIVHVPFHIIGDIS